MNIMMKKIPKVSVLTPIYNTDIKHLREMIESILNQTFSDFEFLILNDSPENLELDTVVSEYANQDKRIKYFKNERNIGITLSRNKLLKLAAGEYLAIFDHDDISVPTRLEKEVDYLNSHHNVGVVSGWLEYFGKDNFVLKNPEKDSDIKVMLCDNCYVAHTAAMIRKSVLIDNGIEYEDFYTPAEDYRLWARLMDVTHFYNIQQVLVKYRWMPNNTSNIQSEKMADARRAIELEIWDKHPGLYEDFKKKDFCTKFRLRLFGLPILKIKNNKIYLFEILPIFTIRWR